ncbi:hypothetical protein [Paramicrobacterium agarici]|uniref:Uncharacterized protein n=1 Tax=Paramicrobacterium agarici TaxID=630514 RepID=A0A2A9DSA5_9MICO|nr:hypothetical protein [Microbacterium agarici]PFG29667.1 hypothetical protein ATJ78_0580 [Microbacterium agarici]TQO22690.1 hypothetical protein FB385_1526 [Microbacterium agarici]
MAEETPAANATPTMRGREVGAQIAGVFGTVFVWVNSGETLPVVRIPLVVIALCALAAIIVLSVRSYRSKGTGHSDVAGAGGGQGVRPPFGWGYWVVVAIEAIALFGGSRLLTAWGHPELGVAWVAFVVGTHFFALAPIFRLARFHVLGAIVTALGISGFVLWLVGATFAIALVSGVASGFALLAFGLGAFASHGAVRATGEPQF